MSEQSKTEQKNKKTKILLLILLLITIISTAITLYAVFFRNTPPKLAPDYAPQKAEKYAEPIDKEEDSEEKMKASEGGGAVSMIYQNTVGISLSDNMASLLFQNPSKSVNDIVLQLAIVSADGEETVIAQSGTLHPGCKLERLELLKGAAELSEGIYTGKYNVLYYDPDTAEKAVLNGNIEGIEIIVTE